MTHDELLERLDELKYDVGDSGMNEEYKAIYALRAVVELHMYFGRVQKDSSIKIYCIECSVDDRSISIPYPCPTIQAIEKELK